MGYWLFLLFHVFSLGLCLFATRSTMRYLSKHQVTPKIRHLPFWRLRTRYVALFYIASITAMTLYSIIKMIIIHL